MNRYGRMAQRHWQTYLPHRYRQIEDPTSFFTQLGEQVQTQVTDLTETIVASTPASEEYLRNLGRWNEARTSAQEQVLAELVLLPAEPGSPMDEEPDPDPSDPDATNGWIPLVEDPDNPAWQRLRDVDQTS
jgi:hypothetical protein